MALLIPKDWRLAPHITADKPVIYRSNGSWVCQSTNLSATRSCPLLAYRQWAAARKISRPTPQTQQPINKE